ncbi:MAG: hypothetical protein J5871_04820 [Bacteroidales bacterium]|nr:hypothetical protein [Bacteroidales bacterium]
MFLTLGAVSSCREGTASGPEMHVYPSPLLHCDDTVLVFSPRACRDSVPAVFLLHGYSDDYKIWSRRTDLQALSDETGFRIICPDGFYKSWYLDNADTAKMQWRSFFWKELWPDMQARYGLYPDKTFITGLSMGGNGAMNIFLDHPERFRGAGSMSGVLALMQSGGLRAGIADILGVPVDDPACLAASAVGRVSRVRELCDEAEAAKKILVITCGYEDKLYLPSARRFADLCAEAGLQYIYMESPATHCWPYWCWAVRYHLDWFNQTLQHGIKAYGHHQ